MKKNHKETIIYILIFLSIAYVAYSGWFKYSCLNNNPSFAVGVITNIRGRENRDIEYVEYLYQIRKGKEKKIHRNSTMIKYSSAVTKESVAKGRKFIVFIVKNYQG